MTINNLYPTQRPSFDLNFARTKRLDPRITFSRSSSGTYFDNTGVLSSATTNQARFDHDPTTGESLGLLVEEARTNYATYSDIDNVNWTANGTDSLALSSVISPAGTSCYDLTTSSLGSNSISRLNSSSPSGSTVVLSVYARFPNSGLIALNIRMSAVSGGFNMYADYYPATEVWGGQANCTALPPQKLKDGWVRLTIVSTGNSGAGSHEVRIGGGINSPTFTNETCQIWGAQVEAGSFPTSYIPTTTATVTRAADVASITGSNFSSWYNQSEGTVFSSSISARITGAAVGFGNAAPYEEIASYGFINSTLFTVYTSGAYQGYMGTGAIAAGQQYKQAGAYKVNDFAASRDGASVVKDTSGLVPTSISYMTIGNTPGGNPASWGLNGTISRLTYYPVRLSDAILQGLTS